MSPAPPRSASTLAEFLEQKGPLTSLYAVLCTVCWLTVLDGRASVTTRDVRAVYPRPKPPRLPRVGAPSETLIRGTRGDLLERAVPLHSAVAEDTGADDAAGRGSDCLAFRLTWRGGAVVEALPDLRQVGALRGMRRVVPGGGRTAATARAQPPAVPSNRRARADCVAAVEQEGSGATRPASPRPASAARTDRYRGSPSTCCAGNTGYCARRSAACSGGRSRRAGCRVSARRPMRSTWRWRRRRARRSAGRTATRSRRAARGPRWWRSSRTSGSRRRVRRIPTPRSPTPVAGRRSLAGSPGALASAPAFRALW
jgi:hypothetical protein